MIVSRILDAKSTGNKASIKINGEEFSKDEDGINIVVVDFNSGQIESSDVFDTTQDSGSAKALVNYLQSLGDKKIIIGATKGNVGQFMFNEVYRTLVSTLYNIHFIALKFKMCFFKNILRFLFLYIKNS